MFGLSDVWKSSLRQHNGIHWTAPIQDTVQISSKNRSVFADRGKCSGRSSVDNRSHKPRLDQYQRQILHVRASDAFSVEMHQFLDSSLIQVVVRTSIDDECP